MSRLQIRHDTVYSYSEPARFGPWRLMMRPLDSHAIRVVKASLSMSPMGMTRWTYDAYGNCICYFAPGAEASELRVVNNLLIERFPAPLAPLELDDPVSMSPLVYSAADRAVLEPFIAPATADRDNAYLEWVRAQVGRPDEPVLEFLQRLNETIHRNFSYGMRDEVGTQSPSQTVAQSAGTCRDFAWLMIESLRRLGFATRFVTGYLHCPNQTIRGAGATHAWCEVFLPDLGWVEFDPTNGLAESASLIRVGATRTPEEASPMDGVAYGGGTFTIKVEVDVDLVDENGQVLKAA